MSGLRRERGTIVRSRRYTGGICRPLKLIVKEPASGEIWEFWSVSTAEVRLSEKARLRDSIGHVESVALGPGVSARSRLESLGRVFRS